MSLGMPEMIVIVVLVLFLFGPDKLPDLARGLGKGIREFRKITSEFQNHFDVLADDDKPRRAASDASPSRPTAPESDYDTMHLPNVHGVAQDRESHENAQHNAQHEDAEHDDTTRGADSPDTSSIGEAPSPNAAPVHALNVEALRQLPRTPAPQPEERAPGNQAADIA